jgi:ribosomal protein S7
MKKTIHNKALYSIIIEKKEFYNFLKKFVGSLIFKGNKTKAIKSFDEILYSLKKALKREPISIFYVIFKKLVPIFTIAYKRMGNRYQPVPKLANKSARVVLMID